MTPKMQLNTCHSQTVNFVWFTCEYKDYSVTDAKLTWIFFWLRMNDFINRVRNGLWQILFLCCLATELFVDVTIVRFNNDNTEMKTEKLASFFYRTFSLFFFHKGEKAGIKLRFNAIILRMKQVGNKDCFVEYVILLEFFFTLFCNLFYTLARLKLSLE